MNFLSQQSESLKENLLTKLSLVKKKTSDFTAQYPNFTANAIVMTKSAIAFYKGRNPLSLVRGAFEVFQNVQGANLANWNCYARPIDGWKTLLINKVNIAFIFKDIIEKFPKETITFKNNDKVDCYKLPLGTIYVYKYGETLYIYYNENDIDKLKLFDFLVKEKFDELESNFLFLHSPDNEGAQSGALVLSPLMPVVKNSAKAVEVKKMITQFTDHGINRSLFFLGPPGTGKTTMAFTILDSLKYKTIVFSASNRLCTFDLIRNLIDVLKIDAIIIDDFDQFQSTNRQLDLLEMFNSKVKVLIGIANSLKDFHPAILRPGRFDEIIMVDELDEECIKEVLGNFSEKYLEKVKKWPIAYIQELIKKGQFLSKKEIEKYYLELEKRVERQLKV